MRGYVDVDWGQLHYETAGSGERTIALFHETGVDHHSYERLAPELAGELRVFAFDTPGCGESDPPPGITTIEEYTARLRAAIDVLGIDRLAVLGVHTGAQIAVQMAAVELPDRVEAVFCLGLPFYRPDVLAARRPAVAPEFDYEGNHLLTGFHRPPREYDPQIRSRMVGATAMDPERVFWPYHAVYKYSPGDALPNIKAPVVFITSKYDILHPGDVDGVNLVPNGRLVHIDSDHLPLYWSAPEKVAQEIRSTLAA